MIFWDSEVFTQTFYVSEAAEVDLELPIKRKTFMQKIVIYFGRCEDE